MGVRRHDGVRSRPAEPRGIVLVLVSSLLVLLLAASLSFFRLGAHARGAAGVVLLNARAMLLSRSGIEFASSRLLRAPDPRPGPATYTDDWTYRDPLQVPLESSINPSYANGDRYADAGAPAGNSRYVAGEDAITFDRDGDGQHEAWSGRLRGTAAATADRYLLRIESEEGKLFVNGGPLSVADGLAGDPTNAPNGTPDHRDPAAGYNAVLVRLLNTLGAHPDVQVPGLGDAVLAARPAGGYPGIRSLQDRTGIVVDLSPYVTCHAWVDRSVIRPQAPAAVGGISLADHKTQRGGAPVPAPEGRAPVGVNVAPRAVLESLLTGLEGASGLLPRPEGVVASINAAEASAIAAKIIEARAGGEDANRNGYLDAGEDADADGFLDAPFRTWSQFSFFCDALRWNAVLTEAHMPGRPVLDARLEPDILKANFNPNSDLNKNNPDEILNRSIDKSDLRVSSTEFALHPMAGIFSIGSLGRIVGPRGEYAAEARHDVVIRTLLPLRQTTQADFVGGRTTLTDYLSPMDDAGGWLAPEFRTFGARRGLGGADRGLSLATYPEPYTAVYPGGHPGAPSGAAVYDGQIGLATVEEPGSPDPADVLFLHRFTDSWTADAGVVALAPVVPAITDMGGLPMDSDLQTDPSVSTFDSARPGTLVPDGAHLEDRRSPMYASVGNLPPMHAVLCYWMKPGFLQGQSRIDACVREAGNPAVSQFLSVGEGVDFRAGTTHTLYGIHAENSPWNNDNNGDEHVAYRLSETTGSGAPLPASVRESRHVRRWVLVTAFWDFQGSGAAGDMFHDAWISILGRYADPVVSQIADPLYVLTWQAVPSALPSASRRLILGGEAMYGSAFQGPSGTMDEFASYDLGDDAVAARTAAESLSGERFAVGRYAKLNNGRFTSSDLWAQVPPDVAGPLVVERLHWTEVLPRQPMAPPPAPGAAPAVWDPVLRDARIRIELVEGSGAAETVLHDTGSFAPLDAEAAGRVGDLLTGPGAPLRYRLTFQPTPGWAAGDARYLNEPVLETPFLDDITLLVRPRRGYPRTLSWE